MHLGIIQETLHRGNHNEARYFSNSSLTASPTFGSVFALGGGLAFCSQSPKCLRIFFTISESSITLITRICEAHLGHVKESTS